MTVFDCLFSHTVTIRALTDEYAFLYSYYSSYCSAVFAIWDVSKKYCVTVLSCHSWINQPRTLVHTIGVHYLINSVISQSQPHRSTASRQVTFTAVIHYFLLSENTTSSKDAALLWTFLVSLLDDVALNKRMLESHIFMVVLLLLFQILM